MVAALETEFCCSTSPRQNIDSKIADKICTKWVSGYLPTDVFVDVFPEHA